MVYKTLTSVLMLSAIFAVSAAPAHAQNYSVRSMRGPYVFQGVGTIDGVDSPSVGRTVFDGGGGCTSSILLNSGGTVLRLTAGSVDGGTCTYDVDSSGFAQIVIAYAIEGGGFVFPAFIVDFIIVDSAESVWIATDVNGLTVARGTTKIQIR